MWQKIKNIYHLTQAFLAAVYFNFPSKKLIVIGVTGTDGKTTTVNMIYHILKSAGKKVSMISSVNAQIGNKTFDTGFHVSTPSPWQVQKYLRKAMDAGNQYFVLEATSHGLDQNRLALIKFNVGVITNVTHEHINYHKNMNSYLQAKAKLIKNVAYSILNLDDNSYQVLKNKAGGKVLTYSLNKNADFSFKNFNIKLNMPGSYNLSNALASAAVASSLGIDGKTIVRALASFKGVSGRMEEIDLSQDFRVFIDFAHTPNGLEQALKTLRLQLSAHNSRLIAVFGAAGERDSLKRQLMGKVADKLAHVIVLTAEDPRSEKVENICHQIAAGIKRKKDKDFFIISDRSKAIKFAINIAKNNDIVGIFGKGHEKSMNYGEKDLPWDEFKVVEGAIRGKINV